MTARRKPGKLAWRLLGLLVSIPIARVLLGVVDMSSFAAMAAGKPIWSRGAALIYYLQLNFFASAAPHTAGNP